MAKALKELEAAVRKLGPTRAQLALRAWSSDGRHLGACSFQSCVLARAYGEPGALKAAIAEARLLSGTASWSTPIVARIFGLTEEETQTVIDCYDGEIAGLNHRTLHALLRKEARKQAKRRTALRRQSASSRGKR